MVCLNLDCLLCFARFVCGLIATLIVFCGLYDIM